MKKLKRIDAQSLVRRRNSFGKAVRKQYERGNPDGIRMKDIRDWTTKTDGICATITTVELDLRIMELFSE